MNSTSADSKIVWICAVGCDVEVSGRHVRECGWKARTSSKSSSSTEYKDAMQEVGMHLDALDTTIGIAVLHITRAREALHALRAAAKEKDRSP